MIKFREGDIICALSTPPGQSALAVVRATGHGVGLFLKSLAPQLTGPIESHRVYFTKFFSKLNNCYFDEGIVTYFAPQKSYTNEETLEFSVHGSMSIVDLLIKELILLGARMAEPGEFSFRSVMSGRLDLVQAQGVLGLIHSESAEQAIQSYRHLKGEFSNQFIKLEQSIIRVLGQIEAGIDFSTEGIELSSNDFLLAQLKSILDSIEQVEQYFNSGELLKQGFFVPLIGLPNAGKSTLLNILANQDRAIVTSIAGTTRDIIEQTVFVDGIKFNFLDTAGIHEAHDQIERLGINKSIKAFEDSDLVFLILDGTLPFDQQILTLQSVLDLKQKKWAVIFTKSDLVKDYDQQILLEQFINRYKLDLRLCFWISHLEPAKAKSVIFSTLKHFYSEKLDKDHSLLLHSRQFEQILMARKSINQAIFELETGMGHELVSMTLRQAYLAIQKVIGHHFDDDILDQIFSDFCIGK